MNARILLVSVLATFGCGSAPASGPMVAIDTLATGTIRVRNLHTASVPPYGRLELVAQIGAAEGDDHVLFGRVADVALGPDGNVYILDSQAAEVRVFSKSGVFVRRIGRRGAGPGEFQSPYALAFDQDGRLWVADERTNQYTVFDVSGTVAATVQRPVRWVLTPGELQVLPGGILVERGLLPPDRAMLRIRLNDPVGVDTTRLPPFERLMWWRTEGERFGVAIPFAPTQAVATTPNGDVWVGFASEYQLVRLSPIGDTLRLITSDSPPTVLSADELGAAESGARTAETEGYAVNRSQLPRSHPYFVAIVATADDYLWVRRRLSGDSSAFSAYDVYDPHGRYAGHVKGEVLDHPAPYIDADHFVGVARDDLDVPRVVVFRIVRGE